MRIVVTGASGQLGSYLVEFLHLRGHEVIPWSGQSTGSRGGLSLRPVELTDDHSVQVALREADPEAIIHTAALSTAATVRQDPKKSFEVNVESTRRLAEWAQERARNLVFTSTDMVFEGSGSWYTERDEPGPVLAYGRSKAMAEPIVLAIPRGIVARLSLLYGFAKRGRESYFDRAISALRSGLPQTFFADEYRTPLHYATAAEILARLAESNFRGLLHVAGGERVSRYDLMKRVATTLGLDGGLVRSNRQEDVSLDEPRPKDASLDTTLLAGLFPDIVRPSIEESATIPHPS